MRRTTIGWLAVVVVAVLALGVSTAGGAPVVGTDVLYTLDADFDQGVLASLNHDSPNSDQLQLSKITTPFPFVNVAASARGTAIRINVNDGSIVGEYLTAPNGRPRDPSRTTVDRKGNVWVTNRAEASGGKGSIVRIGVIVGGTRTNADGSANPLGDYLKPPFAYSTCTDRDGDALIYTSRGLGDIRAWTNAGGADDNGGVSTATDECVINYTRTAGTNARTVAVDAANDVWVGGLGNSAHEKLSGVTGNPVAGTQFNLFCGGYGGLINPVNGLLFSARGPNGLLIYDPSTSTGACYGFNRGDYGLGVDPNTGEVWHTNLNGDQVWKLSPTGAPLGVFAHGFGNAQGVAVDSVGNVWVAHSLFGATTVGHLRTDGTFVGNVPLPGGNGPTGVAVDTNGKVWVANINSNNAMRIDPAAGPVGGGGFAIGAVDMTVDLGAGAGPYNYSDMTGAVLGESISPFGTWTVVQDGGAPGTVWGTITWNTEPQGATPGDSTIVVEARAAATEAGLAAEAWTPVANGVLFNLPGRFIEARATLTAASDGTSPILSDLRITAEPQDADVSVTKSDDLDPREYGSGNVTYTIQVANAGPADATDVAVSDTLSGPGSITAVSPASCAFTATTVSCAYASIPAGGSETIVVTVTPSGPGLFTDTVTASAEEEDPATGNNTDTETTAVVDTTRPTASCTEGPNPSGNIPSSGSSAGKSGQNPDGYYTLHAADNVGVASIVVADSGSSFVSLPFADGDHVKITQAPGGTPSDTRPGPGVITSHLKLNGDAILRVTDTSGNVTEAMCLVPPPPK